MNARILYIDDEEDLLEVISAYFEEEGIPIETCSDLESARKLISESSFDLIISDLNMPSGNVFDLLSEVINAGLFSGKIAIASGDVGKVPEMVDEVILKPFDFEELLVKIRQLLSN